jgi:hypothetical protein
MDSRLESMFYANARRRRAGKVHRHEQSRLAIAVPTWSADNGIRMIVLRPTNLHWIDGSLDDAEDLCAHSAVDFRIGDSVLVKPSDGDWTVSAAALYLLRTLSQPHTKQQPITEFLFPCCGNGIFEVEGQGDVQIVGCNSGIDFGVMRVRDEVILTANDGTEYRVAFSEWQRAVWNFSDSVRAFYSASSPKEPEDDYEQRSFLKFLSEWSRRRSFIESA